MKRNRHRLSRFVAARIPAVRAVRAWRALLPDWKPTLEQLQALDRMPMEHRQAVRVLAYDWSYDDPRWDVLVALLEWERREERKRRNAADELTRLGQELNRTGGPIDITEMITDNVVSMDAEYERLRHTDETTIETKLPQVVPGSRFTLVPNPKGPEWYTVRTLKEKNDD